MKNNIHHTYFHLINVGVVLEAVLYDVLEAALHDVLLLGKIDKAIGQESEN